MNIEHLPNRLADPEISSESPFKNDKLKRDDFVLLLNTVVEIYSDTGCVLAINGEWGTGKTTFIKMWLEYLNLHKYRTVYFNAWETDYVSDPFVALVSELKGIIGDNEDFREYSSKVCRILLSAGKTFIKNKTGVDIDGVTEILNDDLKEYAEQKTTVEEFKASLEEYVASVTENEQFPVIFVIDELDRCNPHFAVKVLERVKHLFDIPNIVFVLPICKSQLECSIKGFYGSNEIDATNYLRRFIDLEFELPKPLYGDFVNYLFEYHKFQYYFEKQTTNKDELERNIEYFKTFAETICRCTNTEIRTMDKIFVLCRIVAPQIKGNYASEMDVIFLLCYMKLIHYDLYCQIRNHSLTLQELINQIELVFPKRLLGDINKQVDLDTDVHRFIYTFASLLYSYNSNRYGVIEKNVLPSRSHHSSDNEQTLNLECHIIDKEKLLEGLNYVLSRTYSWTSLKEITDRIDLVLLPSILGK